MDTISPDISSVFARDARIVRVAEYASGWVANAYRWPAPGIGHGYLVRPDGTIYGYDFRYDRKRPHGRGPRLVGYSSKGGRLYSV